MKVVFLALLSLLGPWHGHGVQDGRLTRLERLVGKMTDSQRQQFQRFTDSPATTRGRVLSESESEAFAVAVTETFGEEKGRRFRKDDRTRRAFRHEAFVTSAATLVDQRVGLTPKQSLSLRKALREQWSTEKLRLNAAAIRFGVPKEFPERVLADSLTRQQLSVWRFLKKDNARPAMFDFSNRQSDDQIRKIFAKTSAARTKSLAAQFQLTPKQLRRFEIASKGAVKAAITLRLEAQEHMYNQIPGIGGQFDLRQFEYYVCDQVTLLVCHTKWSGYVRSVLTDEQQEIYDRAQEFRVQQAHDGFLRYMAAIVSDQMKLTGSEQSALYNLFQHETKADPRALRYSTETLNAIAKIPVEKFDSVLPTDIATRIHRSYDRIRNTAGPQDEANNEGGDQRR